MREDMHKLSSPDQGFIPQTSQLRVLTMIPHKSMPPVQLLICFSFDAKKEILVQEIVSLMQAFISASVRKVKTCIIQKSLIPAILDNRSSVKEQRKYVVQLFLTTGGLFVSSLAQTSFPISCREQDVLVSSSLTRHVSVNQQVFKHTHSYPQPQTVS